VRAGMERGRREWERERIAFGKREISKFAVGPSAPLLVPCRPDLP